MLPTRMVFRCSFILLTLSYWCKGLEHKIAAEDDILLRDEEAEDKPLCSNHIHKFYRQMKCEPETTPGARCPTSYKCPTLEGRKNDSCYYDNKEYPLGANLTLDSADFHNPCIQSCQCVKVLEEAGFRCSAREQKCEALPPGCKRLPFQSSYPCCHRAVASCNKGEKVRCKYNGITYDEGSKFYPVADFTCIQCVCAAGFNGSISPPYCQQFPCVPELQTVASAMFTRGCIPAYMHMGGCCPISFRCPRSTDSIIKAYVKPMESISGKVCKFGNLTLEIGDRLSTWYMPGGRGRETVCYCLVPPLASCLVRFHVTPEQRMALSEGELLGDAT
ncbi:kielin/chordin-like protein [Homalodisca vitripennis]|uniref:kielin/chordin-like protein n=1 Tax=Homalodisca vitripennis TaxID=197043 RepID=UPI001EEB20D6|nr:kielin/chordin-like protein [Homalodisca vitripennis]